VDWWKFCLCFGVTYCLHLQSTILHGATSQKTVFFKASSLLRLFLYLFVTVTVYFQILTLLFLLFLLADCSGDVELCLKCSCHKKVLIKPLYTISCSHLGLQDTFRNLEQWPEYSQQKETRMAVNFDWNDIKHLKKFPNISGIVSLSLQHNKMTKIEGSAFVELDNLKVLDLSYNQLTGNRTFEINLNLLKVLIGTSNIIQYFVWFCIKWERVYALYWEI